MKRLFYIICLIFPVIAFSQESKWYITIGEPNENEWPSDIIGMYDKGYLLSGGIEIENNCGLHAKLGINGSILFDKMLTHNHANMSIMSIGENPEGELISCGAVFYDNNTWPFLNKYDACGERIWCKHFPGEIQETNGVAWDIEFSNDGNILLLASYYSWDIESSRIYIICVDPNGTELWKQPYATKDNYPWMEDPYGWDLILNNEEYYIAGECYYPYPNDTNHVYLRPLFVGIDSVFHEKWVMPFYEMDSIYGWAESMVPLNDSVIMSAGIRLASYGEEANSLLMFFNSNGKEVGYNQITNEQIGPDIVANWIHELERINDTLFIAASIFGPNSGVNPIGELVFDTAANLYNFKSRPNTKQKPIVTKTYDENYVFSTTINQGNDWDIYLYKIDKNLNPVPFDTTQHVYDSLCPHTIQSGEMDLTDCLVITGIEDWPTPDEYYESIRWIPIQAYPNPVTEGKLTLEFENTDHHSNMELRCYDDFGRQIHNQKIYKGQQDTELDVSGWSPGIYIAVVYSEGSVRGKAKFVVR